MLDVVIRHDQVVLDACCIINIAATDEFENILEAASTQFVVASYVLKHEVLTYITLNGQEVPIHLGALIAKNRILEASVDYSKEDEANYIVAFEAQNLDAGEAESAEIAINRGWAIATDDKRAINVVAKTSPNTQILTTPELMKCWADTFIIPEERVKRAIKAIRKYAPPNSHPLASWWQEHGGQAL